MHSSGSRRGEGITEHLCTRLKGHKIPSWQQTMRLVTTVSLSETTGLVLHISLNLSGRINKNIWVRWEVLYLQWWQQKLVWTFKGSGHLMTGLKNITDHKKGGRSKKRALRGENCQIQQWSTTALIVLADCMKVKAEGWWGRQVWFLGIQA